MILNDSAKIIQRDTLLSDGNYNKKEWVDGEVIYKEDLNTIEDIAHKNRAKILEYDEQFVTFQNEIVETVTQTTTTVLEEKIADGTIANLAVADNSITQEKLADGAVTLEKTSFLQKEFTDTNYFIGDGVLINNKIVSPANGVYSTIVDENYVISNFIQLYDSTTSIKIYSYGRIAFFDENNDYIDALGSYETNIDTNSKSTVELRNYPSLSNAKFIKVCIKKKYINDMYITQGGIPLVNSDNNAAYYINFDNLRLTKTQINHVLDNASYKTLSISAIKEIDVAGIGTIEYHDGFKISSQGDTGYEPNVFELVENDEATTTGLIPINANNSSTWQFKNISRIAFFDEEENFIANLYDTINSDSSMPPTETVNIFNDFPVLRNSKYVRLTVLSIDKNNWSLIIDDTDYFSNTQITIRDLSIDKSNLSDEIKSELSKLDDNTFNFHKDTTIVFKKGIDFASTHFRIPFMCVTNQGTIIAGCDIRYNSSNDHSLIDLGTARSEDGGKTWIDKTVAIPNPGVNATYSRVMDGTILATKEGRVFLIGNKFDTGNTGWTNINTPNDPNWDIVLYHSDDDGRTWEFNQSLKSLLPEGQISFLGGVGSGIQMKNGTLVFPIQMAKANDRPFNCQSGIIYSTNHGVTWNMCESLVNEYTSECSVVEYPTDTIIINCRQEGQDHRSIFKTTNLGSTWEETPMNTSTQQTNPCQGHMCKIKVGFDTEVILFTNPVNDGTNRSDGAYAGYDRSNLSLSILQNDTKFTPIHTIYRPHSDGYSCMAFDEKRNRLYVVMELEHNLVFKDMTDLLPVIQMYKNLEI